MVTFYTLGGDRVLLLDFGINTLTLLRCATVTVDVSCPSVTVSSQVVQKWKLQTPVKKRRP